MDVAVNHIQDFMSFSNKLPAFFEVLPVNFGVNLLSVSPKCEVREINSYHWFFIVTSILYTSYHDIKITRK